MERLFDRFDNMQEINETVTQDVEEINEEDLDICEQQLMNALNGVNQYIKVLGDNIKDIESFEARRAKVKEAATQRAATKQNERLTRSSTNREHSYGKV